jgi:hypothetical protein
MYAHTVKLPHVPLEQGLLLFISQGKTLKARCGVILKARSQV